MSALRIVSATGVSFKSSGRNGSVTAARRIARMMSTLRTTMKVKNGTSAGCRKRPGGGA